MVQGHSQGTWTNPLFSDMLSYSVTSWWRKWSRRLKVCGTFGDPKIIRTGSQCKLRTLAPRSEQGASHIAPQHQHRPLKSSLLMSFSAKVLNKLLTESNNTLKDQTGLIIKQGWFNIRESIIQFNHITGYKHLSKHLNGHWRGSK